MKEFFITTAIDYANGTPHLGHAYEKVLTDVVARFRRLMGDRVWFLTGLDEHGQKVQQSARARGIEPGRFVDEIAVHFKELCAKLEISNDDFIRTTEERHKRVVRDILQRLFDKGEIYKAEYKGYYSARQEQFLQEKDRNPDKTWPELFGEVVEITEANYFFKLRNYQEWLVEYLQTNENFILPRYRQKQVLEFLGEPLNDLCISRPRERLEWGIPLPFDEEFVTYVWFDALLNYYSAVANRPGTWPADFHVIGKDILVPPHAVYWPIMLKASGIEPPRSLLVHGWWSINGAKMSKSTGNFVDPVDFVNQYGADALRYFLIREMSVGQDSDFSLQQFMSRYQSELANTLGNLANRTLNMINRFAGGHVPAAGVLDVLDREIRDSWNATRDAAIALNSEFQFHLGLEHAMQFAAAINRYAEQRAPWKLGKSSEPGGQQLLETTLATMAEGLRLVVALLAPVMPSTAVRVRALLGAAESSSWKGELEWGSTLDGSKAGETAILFPRPVTA
ncbi:MAG TPA: methionine--tRNA ligase [Opitutaceae bacterium]